LPDGLYPKDCQTPVNAVYACFSAHCIDPEIPNPAGHKKAGTGLILLTGSGVFVFLLFLGINFYRPASGAIAGPAKLVAFGPAQFHFL